MKDLVLPSRLPDNPGLEGGHRLRRLAIARRALRYRIQNFATYFGTWFLREGRLFWKIYVYFRWVDDQIDDPHVPQDAKARFLRSQIRFLESQCTHGLIRLPPASYEENLMCDALGSTRHDAVLQQRLIDLMRTFEFDVERFGGRKASYDELMQYSRRIGAAYACVLCRMMGLDALAPAHQLEFQHKYGTSFEAALAEYSHYCHLVHILRDYAIDQELGYDNLPREQETYEQFAAEIITMVLARFKRIEYEHFFLLVKYRVSFFLSLVVFCYYARFVSHLEALRQNPRCGGSRSRFGLPRAIVRFLRNRFYYLDSIDPADVCPSTSCRSSVSFGRRAAGPATPHRS